MGVCNEKSIGAVVKYMGWKTPGPLPVRLCPPTRLRTNVESFAVDTAFLDSAAIQAEIREAVKRSSQKLAALDIAKWSPGIGDALDDLRRAAEAAGTLVAHDEAGRLRARSAGPRAL